MKKSNSTLLTDSQKRIRVRMLAIARKRNAKGSGYVLGSGYNSNWNLVLGVLIGKKELVTKKGKKGYWTR